MDLTQRRITSRQRRNTREEENVIRDIPETISRAERTRPERKKEPGKCRASTLASLPPSRRVARRPLGCGRRFL
ncbi:hypothetical protein E2C01_043009 [Portunus trituberculatus]|uniref:Uncharacterized protein n=1 Tax=Portunus trituberculatus TaxID=210409 RepID=A0A5B7FW64_PORTR|nr:hypothetical protein [Portunus trituberculatus]